MKVDRHDGHDHDDWYELSVFPGSDDTIVAFFRYFNERLSPWPNLALGFSLSPSREKSGMGKKLHFLRSNFGPGVK